MDKLTHKDAEGSLKMVPVGDKQVTKRRAVARGEVDLKGAAEAVKKDKLEKGSIDECARIAGILAAKKTADLIPLCHPLNLSHIALSFIYEKNHLIVTAEVETEAKTGAEMEALTAVSVACLTVYDMAKGLEKGIEIKKIELISKSGGKSGDWSR